VLAAPENRGAKLGGFAVRAARGPYGPLAASLHFLYFQLDNCPL